jgi:hypothetical protein
MPENIFEDQEIPEATKPKFDEATGLQFKLRSRNVAILTDALNLQSE